MAKNRTIVKSCPKCELQVAVASKSCKCGYSFFNARRGVQTSKSESDERRRTSRVRREKPNYYDSQEFDRKKNKRNKVRLKLPNFTPILIYFNFKGQRQEKSVRGTATRRRKASE